MRGRLDALSWKVLATPPWRFHNGAPQQTRFLRELKEIMAIRKSAQDQSPSGLDTAVFNGRNVQGFALPQPILRKLYHDNALKWSFPGIPRSQ